MLAGMPSWPAGVDRGSEAGHAGSTSSPARSCRHLQATPTPVLQNRSCLAHCSCSCNDAGIAVAMSVSVLGPPEAVRAG